jgi:hypothetical protein
MSVQTQHEAVRVEVVKKEDTGWASLKRGAVFSWTGASAWWMVTRDPTGASHYVAIANRDTGYINHVGSQRTREEMAVFLEETAKGDDIIMTIAESLSISLKITE